MGTASGITRAASKQTYYTIRLLVDRPRVEDAYRAYAYFRWVDDVLDAEAPSHARAFNAAVLDRVAFLVRQKALLDRCLRGDPPRDATPHEAMLVELVQHAGPADASLERYLRNMMRVMDFDVARRGRLISGTELAEYTRWLATAVTEAMHHFIGNGGAAPMDETRYLAATGAHILHMLRDTYADLGAGYFNVPRDVLATHAIEPWDVDSDAYRAWVADRVKAARACFDGGRAYYARVQDRRHRLAGLAYMARFEWLMDVLERENYRLRPDYSDEMSLRAGLRLAWLTIAGMVGLRWRETPSRIGTAHGGRT